MCCESHEFTWWDLTDDIFHIVVLGLYQWEMRHDTKRQVAHYQLFCVMNIMCYT